MGERKIGWILTPILMSMGLAGPLSAEEAEPEHVGQPPAAETERPEVTTLYEVGGVLTPRNTLRVEPTFEFTHTSISRFNVRGFEIVQGAVLIGTIEAFEADRDTLTQALTLRYGVTNRLELDVTVPGVYRDERFVNTIPSQSGSGNPPTITSRGLSEYGLGDVEFGAHYQLNSGAGGWPYVVGNLRVKSDTGVGPFEVERDSAGIERELPTGSGFWGIGPSVTLISPQGPAVLYGNLGYLVNLPREVNENITSTTRVEHVDPGDSVSVTVGMGLAVTQDLSFNLGWDYAFIFPTETDFGNVVRRSSDLQVGSVLFGLGYRFSECFGTNLTVSIGATEDAPDFRVNLRLPISLRLPDPHGLFD